MFGWTQCLLDKAGLIDHPTGWTTTVRLTRRFEVYLVGREAAVPQWVLKRPRDPESAAMLEREHRLLDSLQSRLGSQMEFQLPHSLGAFPADCGKVWIQTALPGRQVRPKVSRALFERIAEWRAAMAVATTHEPATADELFCEGVWEPELGGQRVQLGWELAERLSGEVPGVVVHGDLNPTNVLVSRTQVGAVDWVWGGNGRAMFDWFDFCCHTYRMSTPSRPPAWREVAGALVNHTEALHPLVLQGASRIAMSLNIAPEATDDLLALYCCSRLWSVIRYHAPDQADEIVRSAMVTAGRLS